MHYFLIGTDYFTTDMQVARACEYFNMPVQMVEHPVTDRYSLDKDYAIALHFNLADCSKYESYEFVTINETELTFSLQGESLTLVTPTLRYFIKIGEHLSDFKTYFINVLNYAKRNRHLSNNELSVLIQWVIDNKNSTYYTFPYSYASLFQTQDAYLADQLIKRGFECKTTSQIKHNMISLEDYAQASLCYRNADTLYLTDIPTPETDGIKVLEKLELVSESNAFNSRVLILHTDRTIFKIGMGNIETDFPIIESLLYEYNMNQWHQENREIFFRELISQYLPNYTVIDKANYTECQNIMDQYNL